MKIIPASYEIVHFDPVTDIRRIALGITTCRNIPMPKTFEEQCELVRKVRDIEVDESRKHHSVLEHSSMSVMFTCNRGVSHELVRHRHTAYSQQSTRYCNYAKDRFGKQITYIGNTRFIENPKGYEEWLNALEQCEENYMKLLGMGFAAEEARDILNHAVATKVLVTTTYREWRSIFNLRGHSAAHYQMRELIKPLFDEVCEALPCVFDDISL
jgi:thymidylate synthase (FAD)